MAATPKYAIPYPVGTDRVMDGDNAMQAIAERVEALLTPVTGEAWTDGSQTMASYGARWVILNKSELTGGLAIANSNVPSLGGNAAIRLVLPKAGYYLVNAALEFKYAQNPGAVMCGLGVYLNVAGELVWTTASPPLLARAFGIPGPEFTNPTHRSLSFVRLFAANDWISLAGIHNFGAAVELAGVSARTGTRLSATLLQPTT